MSAPTQIVRQPITACLVVHHDLVLVGDRRGFESFIHRELKLSVGGLQGVKAGVPLDSPFEKHVVAGPLVCIHPLGQSWYGGRCEAARVRKGWDGTGRI